MGLFDAPLTIKQLAEVEELLCKRHGVNTFSELTYAEDDDDENAESFISFIDKHRQNIDPFQELSVYEEVVSADVPVELQSYVEQLSVINTSDISEERQPQHAASTHGRINSDQFFISSEKFSTIERAVKYKYGGSISLRKVSQIIRKAKRKAKKNKHIIIR